MVAKRSFVVNRGARPYGADRASKNKRAQHSLSKHIQTTLDHEHETGGDRIAIARLRIILPRQGLVGD